MEFIKKIELIKRTATHYRLAGHFKSPVDYGELLKAVELS